MVIALVSWVGLGEEKVDPHSSLKIYVFSAF